MRAVHCLPVSPGWSGQCPVLFTKDYSVVVFLPPELFHTLYEALRQPGGPKVSLKACTNAVGPEIVTAIYGLFGESTASVEELATIRQMRKETVSNYLWLAKTQLADKLGPYVLEKERTG